MAEYVVRTFSMVNANARPAPKEREAQKRYYEELEGRRKAVLRKFLEVFFGDLEGLWYPIEDTLVACVDACHEVCVEYRWYGEDLTDHGRMLIHRLQQVMLIADFVGGEENLPTDVYGLNRLYTDIACYIAAGDREPEMYGLEEALHPWAWDAWKILWRNYR